MNWCTDTEELPNGNGRTNVVDGGAAIGLTEGVATALRISVSSSRVCLRGHTHASPNAAGTPWTTPSVDGDPIRRDIDNQCTIDTANILRKSRMTVLIAVDGTRHPNWAGGIDDYWQHMPDAMQQCMRRLGDRSFPELKIAELGGWGLPADNAGRHDEPQGARIRTRAVSSHGWR